MQTQQELYIHGIALSMHFPVANWNFIQKRRGVIENKRETVIFASRRRVLVKVVRDMGQPTPPRRQLGQIMSMLNAKGSLQPNP